MKKLPINILLFVSWLSPYWFRFIFFIDQSGQFRYINIDRIGQFPNFTRWWRSIFTKFKNLKSEKQNRILNAAIEEFTLNGYKHTSTDTIAKKANISKGSLFHYFRSKKDLFLYLYDYAFDILINQFFEKIVINETDLLARLRHFALLRVELAMKYPHIFDFIRVAYFEEAEEVKGELALRNKEKIEFSYQKALEGVDISQFRDDIDHERAINTCLWTLVGFTKQMEKKAKQSPLSKSQLEQIATELDGYIDLLRTCLYKKG
jgi:TetR/AcrR family transcriptional regulator